MPFGLICSEPPTKGDTTLATDFTFSTLLSIARIAARWLGDRAGLGLEDDLVDVAGLALEPGLQERERVGRVRARQREGVRVGGAEGLGERVHAEEEDDPEGEDQPAASIGKAGERLHEGGIS